MSTELPKHFVPAEIEKLASDCWTAENLFHAEPTDPGPPFGVVIPPPNVTGALHLGHALNNTLQDIIIRWRRMCGDNAVWLPGTDHAGIATQAVVEKRLLGEGKRRTDFTREKFIEVVQAWKDEYEARIIGQLKAMGCSCDWDRLAFTMDAPRARAVREAFFRLFKDGLIYRGKRLVNWDPVSQTALADDEVEMEEVDGFFYYLRYPVVEQCSTGFQPVSSPVSVTVATTRPETMLGDTAVAINPKDPRAAELRGKFVKLPIVNRVIPIIEDDYVVLPVSFGGDPADPKAQFATGFLKVTPAHDPNDYEIGQRHNLPIINVMAPDASISDKHGWPAEDAANSEAFLREQLLGKSREDARTAVVNYFREHGLLEDQKPYKHSVGHSYRSHVPIEPYLSDQWYLKVTDPHMAKAANAVLLTSRERERPEESIGIDNRNNDDEESPTVMHAGARERGYFITFTTYGAWLHGTDRHSVDRNQNLPGTEHLVGNEDREKREFAAMKQPPVTLDEPQRTAIQNTIREVCRHRGWALWASHVRTTHVHVVVSADATPEKVMNDFKAYATRRLRENKLAGAEQKVWTHHGSTRYLNNSESVDAACRYVIDEQGAVLEPPAFDGRISGYMHAREGATTTPPVAYARGSLSFHPARYAKMYENWHDNIRDWCISRQLWWGHRIPVWTISFSPTHGSSTGFSDPKTFHKEWMEHEDACRERLLKWLEAAGIGRDDVVIRDADRPEPGRYAQYITSRNPRFDELFRTLERQPIDRTEVEGLPLISLLRQDPDVLDTWFSSALWPMSTLGWPEPSAINDPQSAINTWNPTSVLCTAREIITLWVSRMVMFNLYFRDRVPFKDVYIHAVIQDGDGRKMSKSLGNGVDPLDIISSHGADALRYTVASMATNTQDVRLPVERDPKTGKNTSSKFDFGRSFCVKLWNAARFVLMQLEQADSHRGTEAPREAVDELQWSMADRWIVSRFNRTVEEVNDALGGYRFDQYAKAVYDFFWHDFCDWYVEFAKPQMKNDVQRGQTAHILASVLDGALRLLHPVIPFVTEVLWWKLNEVCPRRGLPGRIDCPHAGAERSAAPASTRLIRAPFPTVGGFLEASEHIFPKIQELITTIRNVRNDYKVDAKKPVTVSIMAPGDAGRQIEALKPAIESMATCRLAAIGANVKSPDGAVRAVADKGELYIEGLVDQAADQQRVSKLRDDLEKKISTLKGRLSNEGYIARAPAKLVQETQEQLAAAEGELAKL